MNIETLLHEEIVDEFQNLKDLEAGSNEYKTTLDGLTRLIDRAIEMEKLNIESEEKAKDRKIESEEKAKDRKFEEKFKLAQMEEEQKDRFVRNCIAVAGIVIPSVITVWGTLKSIEFEKEGTITTIMGRGFINKLLPKK